jgi:protein farnesyltransferase subunit beta
LDTNWPWLCCWSLHAITLLEERVEPELEDNIVEFLSHCQYPNGGNGGASEPMADPDKKMYICFYVK